MNLTSALSKTLYWPVCRAYAKHILGDRPADLLFRYLCSLQFRRVFRFWPDFVHPTRFSEKLWHRMLFDRDPSLTVLSDKLRVREYVENKIGSEYLIPLLWSGTEPDKIPFGELPRKFVMKTNHGCGYNIVVKEKGHLDCTKARRRLSRWLRENYCQDTYIGTEWAYKNIEPCIVIESFIGKGKPPADYKFYCFSGRVEIITVHFDRFEQHQVRVFDRDFKPHTSECGLNPAVGGGLRASEHAAMVQVAERLSTGLDFIRVDLYGVDGRVYFGELTVYPAGASFLRGFDVASQDDVLGEKWAKSTLCASAKDV